MNLEQLRIDRQKWMSWKNIMPLREALDALEDVDAKVEFGDVVKISASLDEDKIRDSLRRACRKLLHPSIVQIRNWTGRDEDLSSKIELAADLLGLDSVDDDEKLESKEQG